MKILLLVMILTFAGLVIAQSDLPEVGKLADIKGKTKVYLASDAVNLKLMRKEFDKQKGLQSIDKPSDADFIIEYRILRTERVTSLQLPMETGQMDVYFYRDKQKVVVWSEGKGGSLRPGSILLLRKFLKARQDVEASK